MVSYGMLFAVDCLSNDVDVRSKHMIASAIANVTIGSWYQIAHYLFCRIRVDVVAMVAFVKLGKPNVCITAKPLLPITTFNQQFSGEICTFSHYVQ